MSQDKLPVVVLISGSGTNLQALIDASQKDLPIRIVAVISNRPDVKGLLRAQQAGIHTEILDHHNFPERRDFDQALIKLIDRFQPGLVVLAGFMRILTAEFVHHYLGRLLNIHPSLLPRHQGLNTHQRALESGDTTHGASIHFVTEELDGGPVFLQARVPVEAQDDARALAARVLEKEHIIYPLAIRWFAEGRLQLKQEQAWLDGQPLQEPVMLDQISNFNGAT